MRRFAIALAITFAFVSATYTTLGCGGSSPTQPAPPPPPATITGTVTNAANGAPVAGAIVAARQNGAEYNTLSNADGTFTTFSASGAVDLAVTARGFQPYLMRIQVQNGANAANVQLQPSP